MQRTPQTDIADVAAANGANDSGDTKPALRGATANTTYDHFAEGGDPPADKSKQTAVFDGAGDVLAHIDWKNHGTGATSGHWHYFSEPGNPASGHGRGKTHYPNSDLPAAFQAPPSGLPPWTAVGS